MPTTVSDVLTRDGVTRLSSVFSETEMEVLHRALKNVCVSAGSRRDVWGDPSVMLTATRLAERVSTVLQRELQVAWITYFDKRPERNWVVPKHRDEFLPILDRPWAERIGCSDFQLKEGQTYAKGPSWMYDHLLAARLAVDRNHADNGPLEVVLGSHRGEVLDGDLRAWHAEAGDVILMHPSCVHASRKIRSEDRRRVLHVNLVDPNLAGRVGMSSLLES